MIRVKGLTRTFGRGETEVQALKGLDLHIKANEFVAIMGPSGSGKSTLMNILGCLDRPSGGSYRLAGQEVARLDDDALSRVRNQDIGFIFQTFHLLPRLSAVRNVMLPLRFCDLSDAEAEARSIAMLEKVGLGHRLHHKPFEMSGGQRQRVAIARALVNEPRIIFADEPTGNLDSRTSLEIMALLKSLHDQGQTIVLVTHEDEIAAYAQRVLVMRDGELQEVRHAA
ncbi:ABC transporter ATP-binding protein [Gallaecimonas sp. GXIMD4217]|uniref:ABC transporter ATP-binding protein n=1 Tax=Gallaecimonas sp. GXIMD4217 TaxID=3131927 RepID=UPI00311ACF4F